MKGARFFRTIQIKLIIIYVLLILIAMQLIGVYFVNTLDNYFKSDFSDTRNKQALLLAEYVEPYLTTHDGRNVDSKQTSTDLNDVVNNLFALSNMEIQVIDAGGIVLSTSVPSHQEIVGQRNTQRIVNRALQGIKDNEHIFKDMDGHRKMAIAKPIGSGGKVIGTVYIVASMEELYDTMSRINRIFISGTFIALALTAILGIFLSRTITKPIEEITKQVTLVAEGNFSQQVRVVGQDEIGQLGETFNYMMNRLKEALSLNEEEREKLSSILSNMSDGVIATDNLGNVILMNRRANQMLQLADKQVIDKHISEILGISKEKLTKYLSDDYRTVNMIQIDIPAQGEQLSIRMSFSSIHRGGKGVTGTIVVLQDVTEQEKLEESRREFVANVSHELRTPLTTIKSYLEALEDGALDDRQLAQRFVGVVSTETERMIRLVTDLLHLSRFDSHQESLVKAKVHVEEMLEDVTDRFSFQLRQKKIRITTYMDPALPAIVVDRDQMDQVLDNLLSNAIKYTGENGTIVLQATRYGENTLKFSIQDDGPGIPRKDLDRIFERFYRVDKARSRNMGGTGLGLSIAREIIKAHGGTVQLDSEVGTGTTISFTLPI